jgi:hypothetical protein
MMQAADCKRRPSLASRDRRRMQVKSKGSHDSVMAGLFVGWSSMRICRMQERLRGIAGYHGREKSRRT